MNVASRSASFGVAAERLEGVPDDGVVGGVAHLDRRVAPEVLVGEEEHLGGLGQRPFDDGPGVARRADDAAVGAAEGLQRRRRVHIGHRGHRVGDALNGLQLVPAGEDVFRRRHVGHRAARGEVGQDDLLVGAAEHVGALGHEVHAAEDDVVGLGMGRRAAGELERVAAEVGVLNDLVALVVVAEDGEARPQLRPRRRDAPVHLLFRHAEIAAGQPRRGLRRKLRAVEQVLQRAVRVAALPDDELLLHHFEGHRATDPFSEFPSLVLR